MSTGTAGGSVYYRARDVHGRVYFADSREQLPPALRASAEVVVAEVAARPSESWRAPLAERVGSGVWPAVGLVALVVTFLVVIGARRAFGLLGKVLLVGAVLLVGVGVYFSWLRRMTGQSGSVVTSPTVLIDDAKRAAEQMKARQQEQQRALDQIDKERR